MIQTLFGKIKYYVSLYFSMLFIDFGLKPLWNYLEDFFSVSGPVDYGDETSISFFISILLLAPLLETLIFQKWVLFLLDKTFLKKHKFKLIFYSSISGILFGLSHHYNSVHIIKSSLSGFVLMFFFMKINTQYNQRNAFISIVVIHALWNMTVWIIRNV